MMNWNQNDTKYILKRLILYFIIACIVFFAGHSCAKAQNVEPVGNMEYWLTNGNVSVKSKTASRFYGELFYHSTDGSLADINGVFAGLNNTVSGQYFAFSMLRGQPVPTLTARLQFSDGSWTSCEIMNEIKDYAQGTMYSAVCNLSGSGNKIIYKYGFIWSDSAGYSASYNSIYMSAFNVFENAQQMVNYSTQLTNIQNSINSQTQAINNQTDWFDQDYSSIIDTEFLDVFDDLFDNDDDVVRQFILIPLNFFVLIYNACSSNTCSPIVLGELYGTTLTIPCINWSSLLGTAVTNIIDIIFAGCLVFGMIRMIKKMINKIMTLSSTITDECGVEVFK